MCVCVRRNMSFMGVCKPPQLCTLVCMCELVSFEVCRPSLLCQSGHSSRVSCTTWASGSPSGCHRVPSQLERVCSTVCLCFLCVSRDGGAEGVGYDEPLAPAANAIVSATSYPLSQGGYTNTHSVCTLFGTSNFLLRTLSGFFEKHFQ